MHLAGVVQNHFRLLIRYNLSVSTVRLQYFCSRHARDGSGLDVNTTSASPTEDKKFIIRQVVLCAVDKERDSNGGSRQQFFSPHLLHCCLKSPCCFLNPSPPTYLASVACCNADFKRSADKFQGRACLFCWNFNFSIVRFWNLPACHVS
jgi:hypothetical protein